MNQETLCECGKKLFPNPTGGGHPVRCAKCQIEHRRKYQLKWYHRNNQGGRGLRYIKLDEMREAYVDKPKYPEVSKTAKSILPDDLVLLDHRKEGLCPDSRGLVLGDGESVRDYKDTNVFVCQ